MKHRFYYKMILITEFCKSFIQKNNENLSEILDKINEFISGGKIYNLVFSQNKSIEEAFLFSGKKSKILKTQVNDISEFIKNESLAEENYVMFFTVFQLIIKRYTTRVLCVPKINAKLTKKMTEFVKKDMPELSNKELKVEEKEIGKFSFESIIYIIFEASFIMYGSYAEMHKSIKNELVTKHKSLIN